MLITILCLQLHEDCIVCFAGQKVSVTVQCDRVFGEMSRSAFHSDRQHAPDARCVTEGREGPGEEDY